LPRFGSKRQVVEISQQIESDISAYLVTITIMNAAVGIAMALAMWLTGVGDPILWGTVAFLLNYVPILGTALGVLIFLFAGLLTIDPLWQALLPAALYLGFHLIEGETVTPMLLARVPSSSSSRSSSGSGCGVFRARSSLCPCWRLLRSSATVFGRWRHLDTFLRAETQQRSEARVYRLLTRQNLFCTNCLIPRFDLGLVVQNHVQQGIMDFQFSVVFDEAQFAEFVHEKAHP
jgi:AI-2E family transporter